MDKSWKTTAAGTGSVLLALGMFLTSSFDNDPSTMPNWAIIVPAIISGIGLIFAKDHNVTGGTVKQCKCK